MSKSIDERIDELEKEIEELRTEECRLIDIRYEKIREYLSLEGQRDFPYSQKD